MMWGMLHSRYPTRETLLVAMAHEAMDMVERVYSASGLAGSESIDVVFGRLVEGLLPMGARIESLGPRSPKLSTS